MAEQSVPLFDVAVENAAVRQRFFERLERLYDTADFTAGYHPGPVEEFEQALRESCRRAHAVAVGAGTHGLHMAAWALGLGPGDEVVVPANTFLSTGTAASMVGATVVESDVDPDTLNLSLETVEAVLSERTKAIFAVNLYGVPAPYDELARTGLPLLEDAAHSHGAMYHGRPSGSLGVISVFSFFPTKVLGGAGDGGAVLFDDDAWNELLRAFRNCGQARPHYATVLGNVYRMHTIQAAFLVEKWRLLRTIVEHRRRLAAVYDERFSGTSVRTQVVPPGCTSSYFAYVVRVPERDAVAERLRAGGIPTTVQYRYLLRDQPVFAQVPFRTTRAPVAEAALAQMLSLPINSTLTEEGANEIAGAVLEAVRA